MGRSTSGGFVKALFGILMLVAFVSFLLLGMLENGGDQLEAKTKTLNLPSSTRSLKHMKMISGYSEVKVGVRPKSDLNYMSKRRVPNGSDPIHNRRAGNSGKPPGQA